MQLKLTYYTGFIIPKIISKNLFSCRWIWLKFSCDFFTSNFLPTDFSCCHLDNAWTDDEVQQLLLLSKSHSIHKSNLYQLYMLLTSLSLPCILMIDFSLSAPISNLGCFCDDCIMWNPCLVCVSWRNLCDVFVLVKYV